MVRDQCRMNGEHTVHAFLNLNDQQRHRQFGFGKLTIVGGVCWLEDFEILKRITHYSRLRITCAYMRFSSSRNFERSPPNDCQTCSRKTPSRPFTNSSAIGLFTK